jgi:GxxExxY protein
MTENELATIIIGCAIKVHKALGPGLFEPAYKECLFQELLKANMLAEKDKLLALVYEGVKIDSGGKVDMIAENKVIITVKTVESITDFHVSQTLSLLRLSGCKLGLIINFNSLKLKDGIKRVVNNL